MAGKPSKKSGGQVAKIKIGERHSWLSLIYSRLFLFNKEEELSMRFIRIADPFVCPFPAEPVHLVVNMQIAVFDLKIAF